MKASWKPTFEITSLSHPLHPCNQPGAEDQDVILVVCVVLVALISVVLLVPWNWPWLYCWST